MVAEHTNCPRTEHLRNLNCLLPTLRIHFAIQALALAKSGALSTLHTL